MANCISCRAMIQQGEVLCNICKQNTLEHDTNRASDEHDDWMITQVCRAPSGDIDSPDEYPVRAERREAEAWLAAKERGDTSEELIY
ncbi:MAG: hypothetical protein ABIH21_04060 [Patescibacteria group bacterium]